MENRYKEVSLNILKLLPVSEELEFKAQTSEEHKVYGFESKTIGWYYDFEEAKEAFEKYSETEANIIGYEIIGPEQGYGEPDLDIDWDEVSSEEEEDIVSDESPEFYFLYDRNKNLISSYFYDKDNPGGKRLEGEEVFKKSDLAYLRDSVYIGDNHYDILIPVEIEGKVSEEYLKNKWRKVIKEGDKKIQGENAIDEPSKERVQCKIDSLLNVEKDALIFKPLVTVKCNRGEEPATPFDDAPRIDLINKETVKN